MNPEEFVEELACLEALDLLEPAESATLAVLADQQSRLPAFQREVREVVSQLAWLAAEGHPPERLRERILTAPLHRRSHPF
jgi:hypothetical protein